MIHQLTYTPSLSKIIKADPSMTMILPTISGIVGRLLKTTQVSIAITGMGTAVEHIACTTPPVFESARISSTESPALKMVYIKNSAWTCHTNRVRRQNKKGTNTMYGIKVIQLANIGYPGIFTPICQNEIELNVHTILLTVIKTIVRNIKRK